MADIFPSNLKSAIVFPLLKKNTLDNEVLQKCRPVSNLSFLFKVIEKVIAVRLLDHLEAYALMDPMQSVYSKGHCTETTLQRAHVNIVNAVDRGQCLCLILLDLSIAFDTVDHTIFLTFLHEQIGVGGHALEPFRPYLSGRTYPLKVS